MKNQLQSLIRIRRLFLLIAIELFTAQVLAQHIVTGTVTDDAEGFPMPSVNVVVKGTTLGTTTDMNGQYSLNVQQNDVVLVFSFIGNVSQEVQVRGRTQIDVRLVSDVRSLGEVVVVGYGTQKKVNLTGAVGVVDDPKLLENRAVTNAYQLLQGVTPGLNLSVNGASAEPGGTYNINIRGYTSINGGGPLVLVDGVRASLQMVNPADIESVTVLKDQASAAIYGAQAAYGVVLITTKAGKSGKTVVEYSTILNNRSPILLPKNMSSLEFANMLNQAAVNDNIAPYFDNDAINRIKAYLDDPVNTPVAVPNPTQPNVWGKHWFSNANTDWYPAVYKQNVFDQIHNINLSGSNTNIRYYVSGSFLHQDGLLKFGDENFNRYTFNGKLDAKVNEWVRVIFDSKYTAQDIDKPSFPTTNFYSDVSLRWPNNYVKDPNGYYSNFSHILRLTTGGRHKGSLGIFNNSGGLVLEPVKNWITNITVSRRNTIDEFEAAQIPIVEHGVDLTPVNVSGVPTYEAERSNNQYTMASIYTSYEKQAKDHYFKGMMGWQYEYETYSRINGMRQNLITPAITSFSAASGSQFVQDDKYEWVVNGFFGRINYNYKEKYLLEINGRADGSSKFREGSRWGLFPSVSAGYVLSDEKYWKGLSNTISFFKLRASYGELGNQFFSGNYNQQFYPVVPVMPMTLNSQWLFPDNSQIYVGAPGLVSPNLTWEKVKGLNFGLTVATLNNKLSVDIDAYRRVTDNMFGPVAALPAILGTTAPRANNATLATKGYEVIVTWKDNIGDFQYTVSANLSDYTGKVLKYNNPTLLNTTYYEGTELGAIWGYETEGIFQSDDEVAEAPSQRAINSQPWRPGDIRYKDLNGDGVIDFGNNTVPNPGDRTIIGNTTPRLSHAFTFSSSWKGFDFNMFWQGVGKRDLWVDNGLFWGVTGGVWGTSGFVPHLDYWTEENRDAYYARPLVSTFAKNQQVQSRYLLDGSYLRLKSMQLGYTIPSAIMKRIAASSCRIYVTGENLMTFTKMHKNFDPEVENNGRSYPLQRVMSVGFNIRF